MARDPLAFDSQAVLANVRQATTEDLLDRVTAYRAGMEPEALAIIEAELRERGVPPEEIQARALRAQEEVITRKDGIAATCSFCRAPAVKRCWGWHRLWSWLPVFPRTFYYCREHFLKRFPDAAE